MSMTNHRGADHNNWKHMLWMLACCLIPLGIIFVLPFLGLQGSILTFAVILLCPIIMFFMMRGMSGGHSHGHAHMVPEQKQERMLEPEKSEETTEVIGKESCSFFEQCGFSLKAENGGFCLYNQKAA